jgi:hypothetical protein
MSVLNDAGAFRKALFGLKVSKATAALPQTTVGNLFTISGGRVLVTGILGEVTTAIQAQANAIKLISNPTTGSSVDLCATVDINALEAGGFLFLTPDLDATPFSVALGKQNAGAATFGFANVGLVIPVGAIELSTAASNTGSVKWDLTYVPLDDGAAVAAA